MHRVLPVPGRVPRHPRPRGEQDRLRRSPLLRPGRRAGDAPPRRQRPARAPPAGAGAGQVQHHQVLHRGVPRAHQDHRQRHHPAEGAGGRRLLRPGGLAGPQDPQPQEEDAGRGGRHRSGHRACRRATPDRGPRDPGAGRHPSRCPRPTAAPAGRVGLPGRVGRTEVDATGDRRGSKNRRPGEAGEPAPGARRGPVPEPVVGRGVQQAHWRAPWCPVPDPDAGLAAADGTFTVVQEVRGGPDGDVRVILRVVDRCAPARGGGPPGRRSRWRGRTGGRATPM